MRGLISGLWHRQIELPSSSLRQKNAIAIEFHQSGYRGWIESDAFIQNPERFHLFVVGNQLTESDCLLFATAIRFDIAYYPVMYTSLQHWADFPNLARHLERLMAVEAIAKTVKFDQYVRHYFDDDSFINRRRFANGHFAIPVFQY